MDISTISSLYLLFLDTDQLLLITLNNVFLFWMFTHVKSFHCIMHLSFEVFLHFNPLINTTRTTKEKLMCLRFVIIIFLK